MNNLTLVLLTIILLLMGCSSNNKWVKIDKSDFSTNELESALKDCKYREVMKRSNMAALGTSSQVVVPYGSGNGEIEETNNRERAHLRENEALKANGEMKHKSLSSASVVYKCVVSKGFVRE